ncbi:hypothetical protein R77567_01621 [Ralstonia sp. LMG 32965]|uniref:DUF2190 domain-containing protein n=1 Tax=Ralstonia flatus TaxID=3058601 RepID=A0AAD2F4J9_9RALS|nr:capsid cement protein [Ralstonia sp. LMG 32965]MBN6211435.1 DUF2190 family protein [Ralstonia pickettii]CAJ0862147.1 hypothetical protein R77567_01621 [Ralstonia sp. LMG 32965]
MANPGFIKTYDAGAAITPYTIVKFTGTDFQVIPAAAVGDSLAGVTTEIASNSGERVDVVHSGCAYVQAGGTIAAGDPITTNASGQAVKAAPASGANNNCIGRARQSAVSGDVFEVLLDFFTLQG